MHWSDLIKCPLNLWSAGAFYRKPELNLNAISPAERDLAYLHHEARNRGLTPSDVDENRYIEQVGKLWNDGISNEEARKQAFNTIYGIKG